MSTRTSEGRIVKFIAGLLTGAAVVAVIAVAAPGTADARKRVKEDFSVTLPTPAPAAPAAATGSIFQAGEGYAALYEGTRARRVGDPLTIVLVEKTSASKSSGSQLDSSGGFSITPPTTGALNLFNQSDASISGKRGFKGSGAADQSNALSGEISVTVAEVYPNGTMLVQGQKRVTLNRGDEFIQIKGIVRSTDITADNRIASTRVADARIAYTGKGDVARAGRQGWLSRFFQVISPF
ncbi:flagellar basal body L-ring protein FlgH [Sphingomonas sp.]|uniref:flagellar basal body L-ring protein FlgH n=1 Tax=Sphingomonas sp. TaxID=28214 RepID=UPI001EB9398B|nr:flagellar basal body L-ring protein FlgH [Sphingomonas sp.]MBX3595320.1 flagellar basal body L-ring protein FlgH [Sphingomonas sp.]